MPVLSTFRSLRRTAATATAGDSAISWLSAPGNPLMRWPLPQPLPKSPPQLSVDPPPSAPLAGEKLSEVLETAVSISSLIRSTPLSDIKATLIRSGLVPPTTNLSSIIDLLIRSHSFDLAWSLLLSHPPSSLSTFSSLFRRYSRTQKPSAAIRTFLFLRRCPHFFTTTIEDDHDTLELLLDALCKEGHPKAAADFLIQLKSEDPNLIPSVRCYNILLHGWFRQRKLKKAESLWSEMLRDGISPTVVTYGTVIEGLCRLRRPDQAMELLEEMRGSGIDPNLLTCNPIVDSLSESGRFKEALGFVERFPLLGLSPSISTYNSLIKGFCKNSDLKGASNVLKTMIGRGILPTTTTYNYFFRYFAKFRKIEEGMNLYNKLVESGYALDRLTYQLLIKMHCEVEGLDLAVQLIKEMHRKGFEVDLAMSTMLVHLLCRLKRYDEACNEFEEMFSRGIVPQYITYQKLCKELKRLGLVKMEERLSALMSSVPHSMKLPATYRDKDGGEEVERRESILKKAQAMSEALKGIKDKDQMTKLKTFEESMVEKANELTTNIRRRVYAVKI
ncbi:pentatricopeptide repeat-containing protein At5g11310, mitochondrial [Phalaenopsis equestris]|uniref:pentatricopeptide repeat-containing protein At5g11310, mitochondrial n=1 Tax=Phalaenopsis equestris TaxID=78828 RepID=UPI0009E2109E|nr:pentatricopeptide repeat-containing protein At5g11310, mitochondrial [Phalaenopsis equestris]XP_020590863.1 pentatricopeptide repeat-containing protein At5g11310, mitochondrial [Phalaenopsis equestris]XP_020590872.1 pentatricopeptide repeat-containing protein At5g11310, mitochondrial [Phalaenopsis equestris]